MKYSLGIFAVLGAVALAAPLQDSGKIEMPVRIGGQESYNFFEDCKPARLLKEAWEGFKKGLVGGGKCVYRTTPDSKVYVECWDEDQGARDDKTKGGRGVRDDESDDESDDETDDEADEESDEKSDDESDDESDDD